MMRIRTRVFRESRVFLAAFLFPLAVGAAFALVLTSCGGEKAREKSVTLPESPSPQVEPTGPKVVFLGDSITAGLHLKAGLDDAFPAVLERRFADSALAFRAINSGRSGDTSAGGVSKVAWVLKMKPDLVVLELGGNDGLRGQSLAETEKNLRTIVEQFQAANVPVLLLGVELPPSYGPDYVKGFRQIYRQMASDFDLVFVEAFMKGVGGIPSLNFPDGLHPNKVGHEKLADNIEAGLKKSLEALKASSPGD